MTRITGQARKKELLIAGRNLIFQEGPNRFTIRRLAEMVGITEPAVYRHFPSKEDLIVELIHFMFEGWQEHLEALQRERLPASEKLIKLGKFHLNHLINHEFNPILLIIEAGDPHQPRIAQALSEKGERITGAMAAIITEARRRGEFAKDLQTRPAVLALMGVLQGSLLRWTLTRSTAGLAADVEGAIKLVLKGFSAGKSA